MDSNVEIAVTPWKKRKATDFLLCIVCQENSKKKHIVKTPNTASIEKHRDGENGSLCYFILHDCLLCFYALFIILYFFMPWEPWVGNVKLGKRSV